MKCESLYASLSFLLDKSSFTFSRYYSAKELIANRFGLDRTNTWSYSKAGRFAEFLGLLIRDHRFRHLKQEIG